MTVTNKTSNASNGFTPSEESQQNNQTSFAARPKSVYQWTNIDVQKWFRKTCGDYYNLYWENFLEQEITGKPFILKDLVLLTFGFALSNVQN